MVKGEGNNPETKSHTCTSIYLTFKRLSTHVIRCTFHIHFPHAGVIKYPPINCRITSRYNYVMGSKYSLYIHVLCPSPVTLSSSLSPVSTERDSASPTTIDHDCFRCLSIIASSGSLTLICRHSLAVITCRCPGSITAIDFLR